MRGLIGALCVISIGGFAGAMIGLMIDSTGNGLWIFGALSGGAIAYAGYDYKETWKAMMIVFRAPWKKIVMTPIFFITNMVISVHFYKHVVLHATSLCVLLLDACVLIVIVSWKINGVHIMIHDVLTIQVVQLVPTITEVCVLYALVFGFGTWTVSEDKAAEQAEVAYLFSLYGNPLAIFYWLFVAVRNVHKVAKMIHNDVRVFCFICASMGATAGWYLGHDAPWLPHPLAALAGALFGIVLAALMHTVVRTTAVASRN